MCEVWAAALGEYGKDAFISARRNRKLSWKGLNHISESLITSIPLSEIDLPFHLNKNLVQELTHQS